MPRRYNAEGGRSEDLASGLEGRRRGLPETALQVAPVLDRVALPVVVEVGEDIDVSRPRCEPLGPLVQLPVRVVAVPPAGAAVKADQREVGRQLVRLELVHLRPVP